MTVRKEKVNNRADREIRVRFPTLTRQQAHEAIALGWVKQEDGGRVAKGDRNENPLDLSRLERELELLRKGNSSLEITIIAEGEGWCAVDKPVGLPSHPIHLSDTETVTAWALAKWPDVGVEFPEIQPTLTPHRLDTDTSGVLIVCQNRGAFENWRTLFAGHRVSKRYLAWVWGEPSWAEKICDVKLGNDRRDARRMVCEGEGPHRGALRSAETHARVLKRESGKALIELACNTGVTHQIRVHLAHLGHPLVGDSLYDSAYDSRSLKVEAHQLRAIELAYDDVRIPVETESFSKLY